MHIQGGDLVVDRHQIFQNWSDEKIRLEDRQSNTFQFYEREVWWVALGKNIGHEIDGKSRTISAKRLINLVGSLDTKQFESVKENFKKLL